MNTRCGTSRTLLVLILLLLAASPAVAAATLEVRYRLSHGEATQPLPLTVTIGDTTATMGDSAQLELTLPPGNYPLAAALPGAEILGPTEVTVRDGERTEVELVVYPTVRLTLENLPTTAGATNGHVKVRARATTEFPVIIPGTLSITPPEGWRADGATRVIGGLSAAVPLTLEVTLLANQAGPGTLMATIDPWGATASTSLAAARPAIYELRPLTPEITAPPGTETQLPVVVRNRGDEAGAVTLALHSGGPGAPTGDLSFTLQGGEERVVALPITVPADLSGQVTLRPYLVAAGQTVGETEAVLRALRPSLNLEQHVAPGTVIAGDIVEVTVSLTNDGDATTAYALSAKTPEWLESDSPTLRFHGVIEPGASAHHSYRGRVHYGPAATSAVVAELGFEGETVVAVTELTRIEVPFRTEPEVAAVAGTRSSLAATVSNPLNRPIELELRRALEGGELGAHSSITVSLAAGESRTVDLPFVAGSAGSGRHTVALSHAGFPAAATATTLLTIRPEVTPVRTAIVRIPFVAEGADRVLIRHQLLSGTVITGSSLIDGEPAADPAVDEEGRAYWLLAGAEGELTYVVVIEEELPDDVPAPELTGIYADREVRIAGDASLADAPATLKERGAAATYPNVGVPDDLRAAECSVTTSNREREAQAAAAGVSIVEPAPCTRYRDIDPVRIVVVGPATGELPTVTVNGATLNRDRVGLIQTDSTSQTQRVEYYGITLEPGENIIAASVGEQATAERLSVFLAGRPAQLTAVASAALANGQTPVRFTFKVTDENGVPTGFGPLTLITDLEPTSADAFPDMPGYQVLLRDGFATAEFAPLVSARMIEVEARYEWLTTKARLLATPRREKLYHFHGSLSFGVSEGLAYLSGDAVAYGEIPTERGLWQFALDGSLYVPVTGTPSGASGLAPTAPGTRFPELGTVSTANAALTSQDAVAFRYTEPGLRVAYEHGPHSAPGAGAPSQLTALSVAAEIIDGLQMVGFAGLTPATVVEEILTPDGTRRYRLRHAPRQGGETVILRLQTPSGTVIEEQQLRAGWDYVLDPTLGVITLARPVLPTTPELHDVRLVVRYVPREAVRDQLAFGVGLRYASGPVIIELGGAQVIDRSGPELRLGASAAYRVNGFGVEASYLRSSARGVGATDRFAVSLYLQDEAWLVRGNAILERELQASAHLRYAPLGSPWTVTADLANDEARGLTGAARLAYQLPGALGTAVLEHDRRSERDVTALVYEYGHDSLLAGLGFGWDWQSQTAEALLRGGYHDDVVSFGVEHHQPLATDAQARSEASAGITLAGGTDLRITADAIWGQDVRGRLALTQPFGPARAAVTYELPTQGGNGNRLRFAVNTPLAISDALGLDLSASYARSFTSGTTRYSAGAAVVYSVERFEVNAGAEVAVDAGVTKLVTRFGASGSPAPRHTLRLAGDYQVLPELTGTLDLAYAYRGDAFTVLTNHRLITADVPSLEGEFAVTHRASAALQTRPSIAYRLLPGDPEGSVVQLGAGLTAYPFARFGLGANGYYLVSPAAGSSAFVWGLEGSYRLDRSTVIAAGYSFGDSAGLTPESRGGWYVRLDLFGGDR